MNWKNIKEGTLLIVKWDDTVMDSSWLSDSQARTMQSTKCEDVGWFLNHDKLNIRLVNSRNSNKEQSTTVIPKGVIRSVKIIKQK